MTIFSSTQPSLRARLLPKFPASVLAGAGIAIVKSGLTYTFSADDVPLGGLQDVSTDTLVGRDAAGSGAPTSIGLSSGLEMSGSDTLRMTVAQRTRTWVISDWQPGAALASNQKFDLFIPYACTITRWTLLADAVGSMVIDIWKKAYSSYPPTVADTITASAKPTLSSAIKNQDSVLTGWTTAIAANDTLRFNIDSISTVTRATLLLETVVT